ncbi:MAG: hypothetical protein V3V13_09825 [Paracoccaceae bacterium]
MKALNDRVKLKNRFARSARIDVDLSGTPPLSGYVLQGSTNTSLSAMARSIADGDQYAFTWTGPYGGGKSSAALLVGNIVGGDDAGKKLARKIAGSNFSSLFDEAFSSRIENWDVIPVTGSRRPIRRAIADMCKQTLSWTDLAFQKASLSDASLIDTLIKCSQKSGILLIIDELGKFLEATVETDGDIHFLQDIAEAAARNNGHLIIVGILHKSFEAYADRASSHSRDEWAKIQGRFQDLSFVTGADESVQLLAEAFEVEDSPASAEKEAQRLSDLVSKRRPTNTKELAQALAKTWPLNPVCSILLGSIARKRFGQNERSVFGFLASAEPFGFREFLKESGEASSTYDPAMLWDYLQANFGLVLSAGSESAHFSQACEAIERASVLGTELHTALVKSAAILELFRNGSGLILSDESFSISVPATGKKAIKQAVKELCDWGILIEQAKLGGYALFSGSDFDLDVALKQVRGGLVDKTLDALPAMVGLPHIAAKKYYFETGVLRSFSLKVILVERDETPKSLTKKVNAKAGPNGINLTLLLSKKGSGDADVQKLLRGLSPALESCNSNIAIGASFVSKDFLSDLTDFQALRAVEENYRQIEGDRIARRAIRARRSFLIERIISAFQSAIMSTTWSLPGDKNAGVVDGGLSNVATQLAEMAFPQTPIIHSELLQKVKPSASAASALRLLGYAMVSREADAKLGFDGFPAAYGLYLTILRPFGLHRETSDGWQFQDPDLSDIGLSLQPVWDCLKQPVGVTLSEVYAQWRQKPFGMKDGVMPVLALAFILANRETIAVYEGGHFQVEFNEIFVDLLLQNPSRILIKPADRNDRQSAYLSQLAVVLESPNNTSIEVARSLFQKIENQPSYAQRTHNISAKAQKVRDVIRHASDPEALLFDDLPKLKIKGDLIENIISSLGEVDTSYAELLSQSKGALARALGVDADNFGGVGDRAENISGLSGDLRFEAFVMRIREFEESNDLEGLLGLVQNKPPRDWSDRNRDEALLTIAQLGRRFREIEAVAIVRDRKSKTEALALVVGVDPGQPPLLHSFELSAVESTHATDMANLILAEMSSLNNDRTIKLAALARAVAALSGEVSISR